MQFLPLAAFKLEFNPVQLRTSQSEVIPLRAKSLAVLEYLGRHPNRTVLKDELWQAVWPDVIVTDGSLVQCIREIRQALNDETRTILRTEPKRGYRLSVPGIVPTFDEEAVEFSQQIEYARSTDGTLLAYAITGSGAPIVRAQHWMTHLELDWQDGITGSRVRALSNELKLLRLDARGTGMSQRNVDPGTLDDWVEDLGAVIDASGLQKCALFGSSGGAPICVRYARLYPERVSCMVLFGPNVRRELHRGVSRENVEATCRVIADGWGRSDGAFQRLGANILCPGAGPAMQDTFCRLQLAACNGDTAGRLLMANQDTTTEADLADITVPTLVLHCINDSAVPFSEGEMIAQAIPGAKLVPLDSINHMPLPDEPAFAKYIAETVTFVRMHTEH